MAPFPFPQLAELREKYTYNITPFPTAAKVNTKVNTRYRLHGDHVGQPFLPGVLLVFLHPDPVLSSSSGPSGWDSEEDVDVDDDDSLAAALGCLGPLGGLLAPELQRYQKHLKGWHGNHRPVLIRFLQTETIGPKNFSVPNTFTLKCKKNNNNNHLIECYWFVTGLLLV